MKKVVSVLLVLLLVFGCFSMSVGALTESVMVRKSTTRSKVLYGSGSTYHEQDARNALKAYVSDFDSFMSVILSGIANCSQKVDISSYNLPTSVFSYICDYIYYGMPEAFNTVGMKYWYSGSRITALEFEYSAFADTASEYSNCYNNMVTGAAYLLQGVMGNNKLTDEQKLLILHDRLALWNTYDHERLEYEDPIVFTAYGALGEGYSVCQGYAMAYMFLLNQIGIDNYYCSSEDLYHGWNIVFVNGKKYHVDITWDDPDYVGEVGHQNFLRSSNGIYSTGHEAYDYDTTPTDTKYDNYFWQDSYAEFQVVNNELYYIDHSTRQIKRYSDKKVLCNLSYGLSRLSNDGRSLFYSLDTAVYRLDLATNKSEIIYKPSLNSNERLCGMEYYALFETMFCLVYNDSTGNYRVIQVDDFAVDYNKYSTSGDTNYDGYINNKDYALLMQYLNGWDVSIDLSAADTNGDGAVNNKDYALLMQYLNGWDVVLK